jgi:type VI secretion system protein ImpK
MRDEVANLVYPVFKTGLDWKERTEPGALEAMDKAQLDLKKLLTENLWNDLGEAPLLDATLSRSVTSPRPAGGARFLGVRYALVCWLDEIFVLDPHWGEYWQEHALEVALYGSRERAHQFWEQAERAEVRPGSDAIEVYYLCVMLGFRGDYRERPEKLQTWVEKIRPQIVRGYGNEPPQLDNSTPENDVPLLTGRDQFQKMLIVWGRVVLGLVFIVILLIGYLLSRVSS